MERAQQHHLLSPHLATLYERETVNRSLDQAAQSYQGDNNESRRIAGAPFLDKRLSWGARGLLAYIASQPPGWAPHFAELIAETADSARPLSRDGVRALIKELIDAGYLQRKTLRNGDGQMCGTVYEVLL